MTENTGRVVSINGNLVSVEFDGNVSMNEICYVYYLSFIFGHYFASNLSPFNMEL